MRLRPEQARARLKGELMAASIVAVLPWPHASRTASDVALPKHTTSRGSTISICGIAYSRAAEMRSPKGIVSLKPPILMKGKRFVA